MQASQTASCATSQPKSAVPVSPLSVITNASHSFASVRKANQVEFKSPTIALQFVETWLHQGILNPDIAY